MAIAPLVCVLSSESSTPSDVAFCKFAQFLGLQTELIPIRGDLKGISPAALSRAANTERVLALGYQTLCQVFQQDWFAGLLANARYSFIYDLAPVDEDFQALVWLTGGALTAVSSLADVQTEYTVQANVSHGNFPVSGRSYRMESDSPATFLPRTPGAAVEAYITVNGHVHFAAVARGNSTVFLLAGAGLIDIDTSLTANAGIRRWYAQLISMSIVLRAAAGPWCWTSPVTAANFIVDDPYLAKHYGFLHYESLMRELNWHVAHLPLHLFPTTIGAAIRRRWRCCSVIPRVSPSAFMAAITPVANTPAIMPIGWRV